MKNLNLSPAIQDWDTNFVYISDMLKNVFPDFYERLCNKFDEMGIPYGEIIGTKDIWCRDYMPIQVGPAKFIGYKYNPDYLNSDDLAFPHIPEYSHLTYRDTITDQSEVWRKNGFIPNLISSDIVLDGGNVVVVGNYILLTDKIYKENNCSSPREERELLDKIERIIGLSPVIISWEVKGDDVYGHTDGMVKAIPPVNQPKSVIISPIFKYEWRKLDDELGAYFNIKDIKFDVRGKNFEKYAWAYINFLQVGNKILVPSFGLPCESSVLAQIQSVFPNCKIDTIEMREIADQGGALHCITWNILKDDE
ncbi:MAG: agmatine deiminase family protein [Muribaculaceae bacterium]|nr:agmatine deiminase family protein [Muribaculaceae bacterium]MDE6134831.1 agmatine deiminase family protein [Muribaculaceae bacterium]